MRGQWIYKIINVANGNFYVGSTVDFKARFKRHRSRLRKNNHHNKHLQSAWNKYGEYNFIFRIVEVVPDNDSLQAAEDVWLAEHVKKLYCYNHTTNSCNPTRNVYGADNHNFGRVFTAAHRQAMSKAMKAHYATLDVRQKHTEEAKIKMRRPVKAISPTGEVFVYNSITSLRAHMCMTCTVANRALHSGVAIKQGKHKNWKILDNTP